MSRSASDERPAGSRPVASDSAWSKSTCQRIGFSRQVLSVDLTPREFDILALMLQHAGEVITRDDFLDAIWGKDVHVTHRTVDTHISSLRRKLEADPEKPVHFIGVRGVGYRFETNSAKS